MYFATHLEKVIIIIVILRHLQVKQSTLPLTESKTSLSASICDRLVDAVKGSMHLGLIPSAPF